MKLFSKKKKTKTKKNKKKINNSACLTPADGHLALTDISL